MIRLALLLCFASTLLAAQEVRWPASRVHGSPEPQRPFLSEQVFQGIALEDALDMVPVPGLRQWVFVQNNGRIIVAPDNPSGGQSSVALNLRARHPDCDHAYGIVFHPQFSTNKTLFITYTNGDSLEDGSRLSRFKASQDNPLVIDPSSEEVLLTWPSGGHNGAALAFDHDGFLYVSAGDAGVPAPPDPRMTGQNLSDLLSTIMRIDVDRRDEGRAYAIPKDNPFVQTAGARPEIWCFGMRNPWKISFDPVTKNLWCGDVGWEQWEQIYLIQRGANYGWSAMEGTNPILLERKHPTIPITPPVVTHSHSESASITGGFVYRGKQFSELTGAYVYGDYETGKIWALWHDGTKVVKHDEIASTGHRVVTFARGEDGELFYAFYGPETTVHRLVRNPHAGEKSAFPRKLSETGLFADVGIQKPQPGVYPFAIHSPMWADGAEAQRYVAIPSGSIKTKLWIDSNSCELRGEAKWPKDSVLAKTLSMRLSEHDATTLKRIETQMLHFDGAAWNAYTYRWNDAGTDADLVSNEGDERVLDLTGDRFPGGKHRYRWRFNSRSECMRCHTPWAGGALSFQPQQIAEPREFIVAKLCDPAFFSQSEARTVDPRDANGELQERARSWLHSNCGHCHRENGGGAVSALFNIDLKNDDLKVLGRRPERGDFGLKHAEVMNAELPWASAALQRIATLGANHMPPLGPQMVDGKGLLLLERWLMSLAKGGSREMPEVRNASGEGWIESDEEWRMALQKNPKLIPKLMEDAAGALFLIHAFDSQFLSKANREEVLQLARTSTNAHIRGLFDRFLPDSERSEMLGSGATVEKIAALAGDVDRGSKLLSPTGKGAVCLGCHQLNGSGRDLGPDLSRVGSRLSRGELIESLLAPSKVIAEGYKAWSLRLKSAATQIGFVLKRDGSSITFKSMTGETLVIPSSEIEKEQALPGSLMPEGLVQSLSAQEVADMVSYLGALR